MFDPFFTTKEVGQGSGMGLSTVHGIVHRHGGHIVVATAPSKGASFRVLLPALACDAATDAAQPIIPHGTLPRATLSGHVAVVDDEAPVAAFMNDLLAEWGLAVTTFVDAPAALGEIAAGRAFDLVISDQTMPGMTGLDFARAAHELQPDVPIVLYTGYGEGLTPADIERAGVVALLRKPVEPAALLATLRKYLDA